MNVDESYDNNVIIFQDPVPGRCSCLHDARDKHKIAVRNGTLVLFPGFFIHEVPPSKSDKDRIVFSFNIMQPDLRRIKHTKS